MKTVLFALALVSTPTFADTLVVNHPSEQDTYTGTFLQLNVDQGQHGDPTGGVEIYATDFASMPRRYGRVLPSSITPAGYGNWHLLVDDASGDNFSEYVCSGFYQLGVDSSTLTLNCLK